MIPYFPKALAKKGILTYLISLSLVSLVFFKFAMSIEYFIMGIMWVTGFFLLSSSATKQWNRYSRKRFIWTIFIIALVLRVAWVIFSYYYYMAKTGTPFEFQSFDAEGYHNEAVWLSNESWDTAFKYWGTLGGVSDMGYPLWLTVVYKIFGQSIIIARLLKCLIGALTCILFYNFARRNIGETPGRMAAIFFVFFPNLIIYCGLHLKETEMIFLVVAFLERADQMIRRKDFGILNILLVALLGLSLFFFRTILGLTAIMAIFAGLMFTSNRLGGWLKTVLIVSFAAGTIFLLAGGTIATEVEGYWESRVENQFKKRASQEARGFRWAKYATGAVLAPMEFVMPFSTMVDTDQANQNMLHGGNFVRNFFGIFVLLALYSVVFKEKNWRNFALLAAFIVGYLGVISVSGYGNAERFLLPALPCLLVMTAYGISKLNAAGYQYVHYWYFIVVILELGWAFFKIGGRSLL